MRRKRDRIKEKDWVREKERGRMREYMTETVRMKWKKERENEGRKK